MLPSQKKWMAELSKLTNRVMLKQFGISMPIQLAKRLDDIRGDIPRSRFLVRLVERELREREEELQRGTQVGSQGCPAATLEQPTTPIKGEDSCSNG